MSRALANDAHFTEVDFEGIGLEVSRAGVRDAWRDDDAVLLFNDFDPVQARDMELRREHLCPLMRAHPCTCKSKKRPQHD